MSFYLKIINIKIKQFFNVEDLKILMFHYKIAISFLKIFGFFLNHYQSFFLKQSKTENNQKNFLILGKFKDFQILKKFLD